MSRSWWPFGRRSDTSKKNTKAPGEVKRSRRFDETRRIVRHLKKEALHVEQELEEEPPPPLPTTVEGPTVAAYGTVVHVNFNANWLISGTLAKRDPITKRVERVARRFDRTEMFYTENGRLIGDDNSRQL